MSYSLYDWNNALQQRNEYVEDRLKDGSPIIAVSCEDGILMLTIRSAQRKIFEVYDRLMMGALGKQSDVESLRLAAVDTAHREGFERSPDDVAIQRLVGFALSPAVKRVYNDQQSIPLTLRAIFAELNKKSEDDHLFVMGYDGEYRTLNEGVAVAAGTPYAEEQAEESLREAKPANLQDALKAAVTAWGIGRARLAPSRRDNNDVDDDYDLDPLGDTPGVPKVTDDPVVAVREALRSGATVEAALLERHTRRESRFRALRPDELNEALADYR